MQSSKTRKVMVTGGAGFIGSALVRYLIQQNIEVINVDKLTYAGHLSSLSLVNEHPLHHFYQIDINDAQSIRDILWTYQPDGMIHLAAESHVDRSIDDPGIFLRTNIFGTYTLLQESLNFWKKSKRDFRFHHVSTDEVFGSLNEKGYFNECSLYQPSSPYSASKASSDHLVRSWHHTYGLPISISNCSNNYGPFQLPEKLIPNMIIRAIQGKSLPIYGRGTNVRDWLFVEDHAKAIALIFQKSLVGETYLVGGKQERTNLDVVKAICQCLDRLRPLKDKSYLNQIEFVVDRPGHDFRYAIDASKLENHLQWHPSVDFLHGLESTVQWYLENLNWWKDILKNQKVLERQGV